MEKAFGAHTLYYAANGHVMAVRYTVHVLFDDGILAKPKIIQPSFGTLFFARKFSPSGHPLAPLF